MTAIDIKQFVDQLSKASSEVILPFFRAHFSVENKVKTGSYGFDPVTEADRAGESVMRRLIERQFPQHGIIGEEFGNVRTDAEYVWVLDPIDGTRSFISGIPLWGTLIGLSHNGNPSFGVMHQPFIRETFIGDGHSAHWRGPRDGGAAKIERSLKTRSCDRLAEAVLMTTTPSMFSGQDKQNYERIEAQVRLTRYSADCYAYCMLASGYVDSIIETNLQPYDIVALIPIIKGAGGIVTTWDGGSPASGGNIVASGDPRLHEIVLKHLAQRD